MPWLVVLGTGSWSAPAISRTTTYKAATVRKTGKGYKVTQEVADAADATGYWWLQTFADDNEPVLDTDDPSGVLTLEDIKVGVHPGVKLSVVEGERVEPEWVDPEAPPLVHGCQWCPDRYPSTAALDRHVEWEHTRRHEKAVAESIEEYEARQAERAELRRLEDAEEPLPPWEREAVEGER